MNNSCKLAKAMLLSDKPVVIDESDIIAKGFVTSMQVEAQKIDQRWECNINFRAWEFNGDEIMAGDGEYMLVRVKHG